MPYIVKSSLDIGGKIIPANELETKKLIEEKTEFLKQDVDAPKPVKETENFVEEIEEPVEKISKRDLKKNKKKTR